MNVSRIVAAIGNIDDELIAESIYDSPARSSIKDRIISKAKHNVLLFQLQEQCLLFWNTVKTNWLKIGAGLTCLCLAAICIIYVALPLSDNSGVQHNNGILSDEPSVGAIGDMVPFVYVNDTLYKRIKFVSADSVNNECIYLGEISSQVSTSQKPSENFQANDDLIGAKIYKAGNDIIVVYNDYYELYSPIK